MKINDLCFEILQKCPNNCLFCSSLSNIEQENIISLDIIKNTIDYFLSIGKISEISLSGGEPLLHPQILEIIKYCKAKNIKTTLYTSGIILNTKKEFSNNPYFNKILAQYNNQPYTYIPKELFKALEDLKLDKIVFDIQAMEVDAYNQIMGTNNNLPILLKSLFNSSLTNIETAIHFVPTKLNIDQFMDILEVANMINLNELRV